jgi:hypothetical protein
VDVSVAWASRLAEELLAEPLPRRWAHTQGVARQARALAAQFADQGEVIEAAAWLHDIGYSPRLVASGFHPLDGARHLRGVHAADPLICELVAHHTGAVIEAEERGLLTELVTEFGDGAGHRDLIEDLTACDMTTGPDGDAIDPRTRITEILTRYPPQDIVHRSISRSGSGLIALTDRIVPASG